MQTNFVKTSHQGLYRRPSDGAYRLVLVVNGKRHKLVLRGQTEKNALAFLEDWRSELRGSLSGKTLQSIFDTYCNFKQNVVTPHSFKSFQSIWFKHIAHRFGHFDLNQLNLLEYQTFANELLRDGLSPKTVKNIIKYIHSLYSLAMRLGFIDKNPIFGIELPQFDNYRYFSLARDEAKAFFEAINSLTSPFWRAFWLFMIHGRRLNEVKSILWRDIDLDKSLYFIRAPINKARRSMEYHASPILIDALLKIKPYICDPDAYVFASPITGEKLQCVKRSWSNIKSIWAIKLGVNVESLKSMRIHDIRHLIADYAINELHLTLEQVAHTLGHTSTQITERYVNRRAQSSKEVIGAILEKNLGIQLTDVSPINSNLKGG
jgi:integrase